MCRTKVIIHFQVMANEAEDVVMDDLGKLLSKNVGGRI